MKHYTYTDHTTGKVLFECNAPNILVADDMLFVELSIVAALSSHISTPYPHRLPRR